MSKTAVRKYLMDIEQQPWLPAPEGDRVVEKVLTQDPDGPALTRLVRLEAGAVVAELAGDLWREAYLLEGACRVGEELHPAGTYTNVAPGTPTPARFTTVGATWIELRDPHAEAFTKAEVRLYPIDVERMPWTVPFGAPDGIREKVLSSGPSGSATRVLEVRPGVDTGVFNHDHHEEVLMLEGSYRMGEEFHPTGTYTCKGPGVDHGPFWTTEGYRCFEVRNYA